MIFRTDSHLQMSLVTQVLFRYVISFKLMRTGYVCSCLNCFICINKHWICRYNLIMDFSSQIPGYQCFVQATIPATGLHVSAFMLVNLTGKSLSLFSICHLRIQMTNNRTSILFFSKQFVNQTHQNTGAVRGYGLWFEEHYSSLHMWSTLSLHFLEFISMFFLREEWNSKYRYTD